MHLSPAGSCQKKDVVVIRRQTLQVAQVWVHAAFEDQVVSLVSLWETKDNITHTWGLQQPWRKMKLNLSILIPSFALFHFAMSKMICTEYYCQFTWESENVASGWDQWEKHNFLYNVSMSMYFWWKFAHHLSNLCLRNNLWTLVFGKFTQHTTKDFLWNAFAWELRYQLPIWVYCYWNFLSNINGGNFLLQNLSYWFWLFFHWKNGLTNWKTWQLTVCKMGCIWRNVVFGWSNV